MSRNSKYILIALVLLGLFGLGIGMYLYNKPHADLNDQAADASMSAGELLAEFEANETEANAQYLNKVIEIRGSVQEMTETTEGGKVLILRDEEAMAGVSCAFEAKDAEKLASISLGDEIVARGVCAGMLIDVNLSRCVLID
jgi:hypothetical protein